MEGMLLNCQSCHGKTRDSCAQQAASYMYSSWHTAVFSQNRQYKVTLPNLHDLTQLHYVVNPDGPMHMLLSPLQCGKA